MEQMTFLEALRPTPSPICSGFSKSLPTPHHLSITFLINDPSREVQPHHLLPDGGFHSHFCLWYTVFPILGSSCLPPPTIPQCVQLCVWLCQQFAIAIGVWRQDVGRKGARLRGISGSLIARRCPDMSRPVKERGKVDSTTIAWETLVKNITQPKGRILPFFFLFKGRGVANGSSLLMHSPCPLAQQQRPVQRLCFTSLDWLQL